MIAGGTVTVELFGMLRKRAGRAEMVVPAGSVADMLRTVQQECPGLSDLLGESARLPGHYLLSIDGGRFVTDTEQLLVAGERVLLLPADAGG